MPGISARSRMIARSRWLASAALAIGLAMHAGAVCAAPGQGAVADAVAVNVSAATGNLRLASSSMAGTAETRIADFRYGAPRMGSTPRLPIPPPHRMRSGSAHP